MTQSWLFRSNHSSSNLQILPPPLASDIEIIGSYISRRKRDGEWAGMCLFLQLLPAHPQSKRRWDSRCWPAISEQQCSFTPLHHLHSSMVHQNISHFKQFNEITNRKPERKMREKSASAEENRNRTKPPPRPQLQLNRTKWKTAMSN